MNICRMAVHQCVRHLCDRPKVGSPKASRSVKRDERMTQIGDTRRLHHLPVT